MKNVRNVIVAFLFTLFPFFVQAESSTIKCSASETACSSWQAFRKAHPFPYQTTAVSTTPGGDTVIILSEPPPIAPPDEIEALAKAVFEAYSPQIHRLRYPIGLDGWLEDIVLQFHSEPETTVPVATASGATMEIPGGIANRLEYLHEILFGLADGFYVDAIDKGAGLRRAALTDLKVTAADILGVTGDRDRKWRRLAEPGVAGFAWSEVEQAAKVRNYTDDAELLVALIIPPGTDVDTIRGEFRRFAIATDYIVGALRPNRGGLALFGRDRLIPLDVLPPLRFETVATLAGSLGEPLGQSYERQRAFAGKVLQGDYAGWDWAPIYLSPQLQDTELGTLLNLADQQLKSWSEHGEIRYATFDYPDPEGFPFGDSTAMGWFGERTFVPSLIFNWNTTAFSTVLSHAKGHVVSAASTTALPVSYIVPRDPLLDELREMFSSTKTDDPNVAITGSNIGSDYFAKQGDPILARVVQNVFLYQILSEAKPFRNTASTRAALNTKRSDAVTRILIDEATRWLTEVTTRRNPEDADLAELVRDSVLPVAKLAELLAAPDKNTKAIIRAQSAIDLHRVRFEQLQTDSLAKKIEYNNLVEKYDAEFIAHCARIGGTIVREGLRDVCRYKATQEKPFRSSYETQLVALKQEIGQMDAEKKQIAAAAEASSTTFLKLIANSEIADQLGEELSARASFSEDLERILQRVLVATSASASTSAIQTASVVLSKNTADFFAVGGHNIDALPWAVKVGSKNASPSIRIAGERPTIVLGSEQAGQATSIARAKVQQKAAADPVRRPLPDVLAAGESKGSFLEQLRKNPLPVVDSKEVLSHAEGCGCDLYIKRGASETSTIVWLKPPPKVETVFGSSRLVDVLSQHTSTTRMVFDGFPKDQVSAFTKTAMRKANSATRSQRGLMEQVRDTAALFQKASDRLSTVLLRTKSGKRALVSVKSAELLAERPQWADAQIGIHSFDSGSVYRTVGLRSDPSILYPFA